MVDAVPPNQSNPYAAPLAIDGQTAGDDDPDSHAALLRAAVGRNADYYLKHWRNGRATIHEVTGFNWAAFLLSGLWLPYRKLYLATLVLYGAFLAIIVAEGVFEALTETEVPALVDRGMSLGTWILCGILANRLYLWHVNKLIAKSRQLGLAGEPLRAEVARRGGTNILASILALGLFFAVLFALGGLLENVPPEDAELEPLLVPMEEAEP